jgi:hypothetical protein
MRAVLSLSRGKNYWRCEGKNRKCPRCFSEYKKIALSRASNRRGTHDDNLCWYPPVYPGDFRFYLIFYLIMISFWLCLTPPDSATNR